MMAKLNADLVRPLYRQDNTDILSLLDIFAQEMDATMIDRKNTQEVSQEEEGNSDMELRANRHLLTLLGDGVENICPGKQLR